MGSRATKIMNPEHKKLIEDLIKKDQVVIFSKTYCPYCKMAKDVFAKIDHKPVVIELDNHPDGDSLQDILGEMTGARSVPRVFINGKCVGGGTDVKALYDKGELLPLVAKF